MSMPMTTRSRLANTVSLTSFAAFLLGRYYFNEPLNVLVVIEAVVAAFVMGLIVHAVFDIVDRD